MEIVLLVIVAGLLLFDVFVFLRREKKEEKVNAAISRDVLEEPRILHAPTPTPIVYPDEYAIINYRSPKSDGPYEGMMFVNKRPSEQWYDILVKAQRQIESTHDAKSPVMITYFSKI